MQNQNLITGDEQKELLEKRIKNAERVMRDFLKLKLGEKVIFVTDENDHLTDPEFISILKQALERNNIDFSEYSANDETTTEKELLKAVRGNNLVLSTWEMAESGIDFDKITDKITKKRVGKEQVRMLFAPGLRADLLDDNGALTENKEELDRRLDKMEAQLKNVAGFHITSIYGTDLKMKMMPGERRWIKDNGELNPGSYNSLPGGDIYTVPDEENINGVLVIPALPEGVTGEEEHQGVDKFVSLVISNGKIVEITGDNSAKILEKYLKECSDEEQENKKDPSSVYQITDIGFGANSMAQPVATDEFGHYTDMANPSVAAAKRLGVMHIGSGSSKFSVKGAEGHTNSDCHLDFVLPRNGLTVKAFYSREDFKKGKNGERLIDEGRWNFI